MEREQQIDAEERLRRERDIAERERRLQARERELRQQPNRKVRRYQNNRPPRVHLGSDGRTLVPGGYNDSLYKNDIDLSPLRNGGLIKRNRGRNGNDRSRGNFNFNLNFGK